MGLIQIEGMEFYAYHGCYEEERIVGNKFLIDLTIEAALDNAAKSDNIKDTINYQTVYNLIKREMKVKSYLIENIAKRILDTLYDNFPEIDKVVIKVSKINPSIGGKVEKVSITLSR